MSRLLPLFVFAALCALLGFGIYWLLTHQGDRDATSL